MSSFWSLWIIVLTTVTIAGVTWILFACRQGGNNESGETTGHVYDGIEEYDNPLPQWWFVMYIGTIIFALGYLALYPGMGSYKGLLGWTQVGQWEKQEIKGEAIFMEQAKKYANIPAADLVENYSATRMGQRLFKSNCSVCHGSDAQGGNAFPNLTDDVWLYGGSEAQIKETITHGRQGAMPAWGSILGDDVDAMAEYVKTLNTTEDRAVIEQHPMHQKFGMMCSSCHGKDAQGSTTVGAPNLTNDNWLYGNGSIADIKRTITFGRNGRMPAHGELLSPERIHLITAYILSLSHIPE